MANKHSLVARWQGDLLPHIVDRLAHENPGAIYGIWPGSNSSDVRTVTYSELANIINGLAAWLIETLGAPRKRGEVLAFIGTNDVRLTALVLAAIKTGYVLFLTSPRDSLDAQKSLFNSLDCQSLITTTPTPPSASTILEGAELRHLEVPSLDELTETTFPPYVYTRSLKDAAGDPFFVIHTSGSTGIPKPIIWTQETAARHLNCSGWPPPPGLTSIDSFCHGKRILSTLPSFHGAGLLQYLLAAIPFGNIVIAPTTTGIVTAQGFVDTLKRIPADVAILVPSVVAELAQHPDLLDFCAAHLELITYIGGDLPQSIGDKVAAKLHLRCQWGASEVGIPQQLMPTGFSRATEWRYVQFHPNSGANFDEVSDGTYELVIRRDESLARSQPAFSIVGQELLEKEYRTRDLFEKHPTVPDAWCWRARADDIIVFLNGEKTNPVSMEQHVVSRNPELSGAIAVGAQRFQASLLVEPSPNSDTDLATTAGQAALIERVWPSVEEANRSAPAHARVEKSMILVVSPDKPFIRAGKGTIQRSSSIKQYSDEIERLYNNIDDDGLEHDLDNIDAEIIGQASVGKFIQRAVCTVTGWPNVEESGNFFELGMDSLQALQLMRKMQRAFHRSDLGLSTIYQYPSVAALSAVIVTVRASEAGPDQDRNVMQQLLHTYGELVRQIPQSKISFHCTIKFPFDIILTGSTGSVGMFLLNTLLKDQRVGHVFCLNRGTDGGHAVQIDKFSAAGLEYTVLNDASRVTFMKADLSKPALGLDETAYQSLAARVSLVIHNAWPVNFNLALPAFRPQLTGLVNLFRLSADSTVENALRFVFVSSISAVGNMDSKNGPASEEILESAGTSYANGYARSKYLGERLCNIAAKELGIPVQVARVGQVAGSVHHQGVWNTAEWLPSLVTSSLHLGCLPNSLGSQFSNIDWVPSDVLSEVLTDVALGNHILNNTPNISTADVFNIRNPQTIKWDDLVPAVLESAKAHLGEELEVVMPAVWLDRLKNSMKDASEGDSLEIQATARLNPAVRLFEFYRDYLWADGTTAHLMSIDRAIEASPTLRGMAAVNQDWVHKWVEEWILTVK